MTSLHRLLAITVSSGLFLAAIPASAAGIHMDGDVGLHLGEHAMETSDVRVNGHEDMKSDKQHDERMGTGSTMGRDDRHEKNGSGANLGNSLAAHAKVEMKMTARLTDMIKHSIGSFVKISKKICNASPNQSTVTACLAKAKIDFKASINTMIDAAFGI